MPDTSAKIDWDDYRERSFADLIAAIRGQSGLNQEDFGKRVGFSRAAVSQWENGHHVPSGEGKRKAVREKLCIDDDPKLAAVWEHLLALNDADDDRFTRGRIQIHQELVAARARAVAPRRDRTLIPDKVLDAQRPAGEVQNRLRDINIDFTSGTVGVEGHMAALENLFQDLQSFRRVDAVKSELLAAAIDGDSGAIWSYAQLIEGEILSQEPLDVTSQQKMVNALKDTDQSRFFQVFCFVRAHALHYSHRTGKPFTSLKDEHLVSIVDGASKSRALFPLAVHLVDILTAPSSSEKSRRRVSTETAKKIVQYSLRLDISEAACASASLVVANAIAYTDYQSVALKVARSVAGLTGGKVGIHREMKAEPESFYTYIQSWMSEATDEHNKAFMAIALSRLGIMSDDIIENINVIAQKPSMVNYLNVEAFAVLVLTGKRKCAKAVFSAIKEGKHPNGFDAACFLGFFGEWRLNLALVFSRNREISHNANEAALICVTTLRRDLPGTAIFLRAHRGRLRFMWDWLRFHRSIQALKDGGEFLYHDLTYVRGKTSRALWDIRLFICQQTVNGLKMSTISNLLKERFWRSR